MVDVVSVDTLKAKIDEIERYEIMYFFNL